MSPDVSERSFEDAIECGLLQHGPDACAGDTTAVRETTPPYGDAVPGGYLKRLPADYDRALCLVPRDVVDFILATQPKEWEKLKQHHGAAVKEQFLKRLAREIERRGALDVLRHGVKDSGCTFRLAYLRPSSGLNEALQRLHAANNTRENVRLTFDQKVEDVIQEIVDSNFELYKRITDDRAFGAAIKNFLFDQYLRAHRQPTS